jgi:hypothetical protein
MNNRIDDYLNIMMDDKFRFVEYDLEYVSNCNILEKHQNY